MKYKLKIDARRFFDEKHHTDVCELKYWKDHEIPIQVLDEVDRVYIDLGHEYSLSTGTKSRSISGWKNDGKEAHLNFSLKVLDIEHKEYKSINVPEVMDEIQKVVNKYFRY